MQHYQAMNLPALMCSRTHLLKSVLLSLFNAIVFFCLFVISVRYSIGIFYVKIKQIVCGTDPLSEISQMENHIQLHLAWLYIFHKHTKKNPIGDLQCSKIDIAKLLLPRCLLQLLHRKTILRLKLIWLNSHHDRFCRSRREACCFQQNSRIASGHHVTLLPQRALYADENGKRWKLEPVIL